MAKSLSASLDALLCTTAVKRASVQFLAAAMRASGAPSCIAISWMLSDICRLRARPPDAAIISACPPNTCPSCMAGIQVSSSKLYGPVKQLSTPSRKPSESRRNPWGTGCPCSRTCMSLATLVEGNSSDVMESMGACKQNSSPRSSILPNRQVGALRPPRIERGQYNLRLVHNLPHECCRNDCVRRSRRRLGCSPKNFRGARCCTANLQIGVHPFPVMERRVPMNNSPRARAANPTSSTRYNTSRQGICNCSLGVSRMNPFTMTTRSTGEAAGCGATVATAAAPASSSRRHYCS